MIELPHALQRWREDLSIFPRDVALTIGAWLPRLQLAFGPLSSRSTLNSGEIDGFGGLARRGPYERLLISEWLMALEYPDEFARRAAMNEHAFLEVARREPRGSKRSVVLFDAGPSQLGNPRLLHLAALVVLARRAWTESADFGWGVLQDSSGWCWSGLTESSITGLIEARSAHEPSAIDLEDWLERMAQNVEPDDLWIVGGKRLLRLGAELPAAGAEKFQRSTRLIAGETLELGRRAVRFEIVRPGKKTTDLELELPEETACIRLLRDPFEIRPPAVQQARKPNQKLSSLVFSRDSRKLLMRSNRDVIALHPTREPRHQSGAVRTLPNCGETIAAVGSVNRAFFAITSNSHQISLQHYSRYGSAHEKLQTEELEANFPFWHPGDSSPLQPCYFFGDKYIFTDTLGRLLAFDPATKKIALMLTGVTAFSQSTGKLWLVQNSWESGEAVQGRQLIMIDQELNFRMYEPMEGDGDLATFFGFPFTERPFTAVRQYLDSWVIGGDIRVEPPKDSRVFGVTSTRASRRSPALLVIENDERTISAIGQDTSSRLFIAGERIVAAAAATTAPLAAFMTEKGVVIVYSLEHTQVVYRYVPAGVEAESEE